MSNNVSEEREGNTKPLSQEVKRISTSKYWCGTFNNYELSDYDSLVLKFKTSCNKWIIGKEIGESGTPHLQMYIECKKPIRPIEFFGIKKIHWEKRKGSTEQNRVYCSKEGDYISMGFKEEYKYKGLDLPKEWNDFQKQVLALVEREHNDREIHWFYDEDGGNGKTKVIKKLIRDHKAELVGGNNNDCAFAISDNPKLVVWNIPNNVKTISYSALESIKDGLVFSSKYESNCKCFEPPIVLVMANFEPLTDLNNRIISYNVDDMRKDLKKGVIKQKVIFDSFTKEDLEL